MMAIIEAGGTTIEVSNSGTLSELAMTTKGVTIAALLMPEQVEQIMEILRDTKNEQNVKQGTIK